MNKTEQHYIDKTQWDAGPWQNEPDRISWVDRDTGYSCLVRRNDKFGFLCGYVAVNKDHPLYEKDDCDFDCHGGLTFSSHCDGDPVKGICHLTKDEDEDGAWWFGFDCGHAWDISPNLLPRFDDFGDFYRDVEYVISEVESLAKKLKCCPGDHTHNE